MKGKILDFRQSHAKGIERGHHRPDTGAGNTVDSYAQLFEGLKHPDVGSPQNRSAAQGKPDSFF
jgi:hypothetical protein